jgi:hypothetical protein
VIELVHAATISGAQDSAHLMSYNYTVRDPDGGFLVVSTPMLHTAMLFDSTGVFVRSIGNAGGGPGEYQEIGPIVTHGDHRWFVDRVQQRISVLDADYGLAQEHKLPLRPWDLFVVDDSTFLVSANTMTPAQIGIPFHLVRSNGEIIRSFGESGRAVVAPVDRYRVRSLGDGTFLAIGEGGYEVERWSLDGHRLSAWDRTGGWFADGQETAAARAAERPRLKPPVVRALVSRGNHLWVLIIVPDPRWRESRVEVRQASGAVTFRITDDNLEYDSIIEVLDLESGQVVARTRIDTYLDSFVDDHHAYSFHTDSADIPSVNIWSVILRVPESMSLDVSAKGTSVGARGYRSRSVAFDLPTGGV